MQIQRINNQQQKCKPAFGTTFHAPAEAKATLGNLIDALATKYVDLSDKELELIQKQGQWGNAQYKEYIASRAQQLNIKTAIVKIGRIAKKISRDLESHNTREAKNVLKTGSIDDATIESIELIGSKKIKRGGESINLTPENIAEYAKEGNNKYGLILRAKSTPPSTEANVNFAVDISKNEKNGMIYKDIDAPIEQQVIKGNLITHMQNAYLTAPF